MVVDNGRFDGVYKHLGARVWYGEGIGCGDVENDIRSKTSNEMSVKKTFTPSNNTVISILFFSKTHLQSVGETST